MNKTIVVLLLCICCNAWGQVEPQVDFSTGTAVLNVPLYTIGENDLKLTMSLNYAGQAIPVSTNGGWVGHNWNLSVESRIARIVRGLPDDYLGTGSDTRKGWLQGDMATRIKNYTFSDDNNPTSCTDEASNWSFLKTFELQDTEPDIFSVALPGGVFFNFYFDENKAVHTVPYKDINISYTTDPTTNLIASFTIVDDKGVTYLFQDVETAVQGALAGQENEFMNRTYNLGRGDYKYNYAWRITKLQSPASGSFINFAYNDLQIDNSLVSYKERFNTPLSMSNDWSSNTVLKYGYKIYTKILKEISSRTTKIEFSSTTSFDKSYTLLQSIKISETNYVPATIKSYGLSYATMQYYTDPSAENSKGARNFLRQIKQYVGSENNLVCALEYHGEDEHGYPQLPFFDDSDKKDDWGFSSQDPTVGLLKKVQFGLGGYTVISYEPNTYFDAVTQAVVTGGGARIRKTIVHDGINSAADRITRFEYVKADGTTSGKLLYRPGRTETVVRVPKLKINGVEYVGKRYSEIQALVSSNTIPGPVSQYFKFKFEDDMGVFENTSLSSPILYSRVRVLRSQLGSTLFEYDLPAMDGDDVTSDGDWQPSKVNIARPSAGGSICYETGDVPIGKGQFPYAPNPNYGYARPLLKKTSEFDEAGNVVRSVDYDYQRIFAASAVRKIKAVKFEEIQTYYKQGSSYVDNWMYLYSGYYINTDVASVLKSKTERLYSGGVAGVGKVTSYFYDSPAHRNLNRITETNSDGSMSINRLKYVTDFSPGTSSDPATAALGGLLTSHRTSTVVESTISQLVGGTEKYVEGTAYTYKDTWGLINPVQKLTFKSISGLTDFVSSSVQSVSGVPTFRYDARYQPVQTMVYDAWGNVEELVGRDRIPKAFVWGFNGTASVATFQNVTLSEVGFDDFETLTATDFSIEGGVANDYVAARTGVRALNLATGAKLVRTMVNKQSQKYVFSCWIKTSNTGNITLRFLNGTTELMSAVQLPYSSNSAWKYYTITVNTSSLPASFRLEISSSIAISIDDVAFYPKQASISYSSYDFPFGKVSETDAIGSARYYSYDVWGRVKTVKDENQNVIDKFDYQVRP